jgi:hypothetical protein
MQKIITICDVHRVPGDPSTEHPGTPEIIALGPKGKPQVIDMCDVVREQVLTPLEKLLAEFGRSWDEITVPPPPPGTRGRPRQQPAPDRDGKMPCPAQADLGCQVRTKDGRSHARTQHREWFDANLRDVDALEVECVGGCGRVLKVGPGLSSHERNCPRARAVRKAQGRGLRAAS